MTGFFRTAIFVLGLALTALAGPAFQVQASDLMRICSPDIASHCKGVTEGRGRISACLYAHSNKLSPACGPELAKATHSSMFERFIPADIRNLNDTPYEASLRKGCAADIKSLCSTVAPGEDRLLACLYAWNHRVSKTCRDEAKIVFEHLR